MPVAPSILKTSSSLVVTYSCPSTATGYDCSPILTAGSIFLKSSVYTRPSCATLSGVISVSGECRLFSDVRPKPFQSPFGRGAAAAAPETATATATAATSVVSRCEPYVPQRSLLDARTVPPEPKNQEEQGDQAEKHDIGSQSAGFGCRRDAPGRARSRGRSSRAVATPAEPRRRTAPGCRDETVRRPVERLRDRHDRRYPDARPLRTGDRRRFRPARSPGAPRRGGERARQHRAPNAAVSPSVSRSSARCVCARVKKFAR